MEIIIGRTAGVCYGVKRAIEGAKKELEENDTLYCLGEIVHNQRVIHSLKKKGMIFVEKIKEAKNKVIIRAHGVKKQVYQKAEELEIEIKDYTCPNVIKIHKIAEEHAKKGYYIFLCGAKEHPENIGTISYCGEFVSVIEKREEIGDALKAFQTTSKNKVLLISQTTYELETFYEIEKELRKKLPQEIYLVVNNTICKATEIRQKETSQLAKQVEAMIIIGGKNSSNTKKLYEVARKKCIHTFLIETVNELDLETIKSYKTIGVMAGASTPQESIDEVVAKLEE